MLWQGGRQSLGLLKPEIVGQFPQSSESIVLPQDESHLDLAEEEVLPSGFSQGTTFSWQQ